MQRTEKIIEIDAPVERVFDLFSDFESIPRWMRHIKEVRRTGRRYTRWTADAPLGSSVEWEAETTVFEPDHRIAWRSVRGDVETEGEVIFEETRRGTTLMRVHLGYDPPAGRLGALVANLFGQNPEQQLEEDLQRFAQAVEGRRREARRAPYDERDRREARGPVRDERRERKRDRYDYAGAPTGRDVRGRDAREREMRREDDYRDGGGYGARDYDEDDGRRRERESRSRFDQALREARRSQLESQRRYREEQQRDEERRYREAREREYEPDQRYLAGGRRPGDEERMNERRRADERWRERPGDERAARHADEERPPRTGRHPMTPREWERDREQRQPDYGYSKEAFRRGVDKLMDEPPSRRWRRWD